MKNKILPVILAFSLAINIFFITMHAISKQRSEALYTLFDVKAVPYETGLKSLFQKLDEDAPQILKKYNYLFVQTWDSVTTQGPRLAYTIHLDSILASNEYATLGKLLISEMPRNDLETYKRNHKIHFQSFTLISDADDFISFVFTLQKAKAKSHPMQTIINTQGELLYCCTNVSGIEDKDSTLYHIHRIITP